MCAFGVYTRIMGGVSFPTTRTVASMEHGAFLPEFRPFALGVCVTTGSTWLPVSCCLVGFSPTRFHIRRKTVVSIHRLDPPELGDPW